MARRDAGNLDHWTQDGDRWTCRGCERSAKPGEPLMHSRACDYDRENAPVAARSEGRGLTATQVKAHGRDGTIASVLTETEIRDAVRAGVLSVGDAMNRDY